MDQLTEIQMLNALEYFHYSSRFQNSLFILSLERGVILQDMITDLRVLNAAKIRCIVVCHYFEGLKELLLTWNERGCPFQLMNPGFSPPSGTNEVALFSDAAKSGAIPVMAVKSVEKGEEVSGLDHFTFDLARQLPVNKVFFLSRSEGLCVGGDFISHLTPQSAKELMETHPDSSFNISEQRLNRFVTENLENGYEIIQLDGSGGSLFQEIFTHRGKGTMLTNDYPNVIRRGRMSDVMEISLLLKPYINSGSILPVPEDDIAKEVEAYYVYTVNNSIVAIAKLTDHGSAMELAKFCTLPRYQGKGRARELAEKMIETVRIAKKDYMFALSVEPKMFDFFVSLGFFECERESLPESWKKNYNMSRQSKSFRLEVDGQ